MKKAISTNNAPGAIGPYSQAVIAGNFIYVSGQLPVDPATGAFASEEIVGQTHQALKNVSAILAEAGYSMSDVVKATVYMKNISEFVAMNEVYAQYFSGECPARAAFEVVALPKNALVEIEAVAYKA